MHSSAFHLLFVNLLENIKNNGLHVSIEKVVGRNGHYHTKMRQNKKNLAVDEKSERGEKWSISIIFQSSSDIKQQNAYRDERA